MNKSFSFNFSSLIGLIILLILGYFLFSIVKTLYIVLLYASPILILAVLFMKKELLVNFFKKIGNNIRQNPLLGIINGLVSILFLPFTLLGMIFRIFVTKKIENLQKEQNPQMNSNKANISSEYVEYEDLSLPDNKETSQKIKLEDWNIEKWDRK